MIRLLVTLGILLCSISAANAEPPRVMTSFSVLQDITQQIAGERAVVETLVGPDADAHAFEPAPRHARALARADLVVINGLGFEGWMERLVSASGFSGPLIRASDGIQPLETGDVETHEADHHDGAVDPHVWHDVSLVRQYVRNISRALSDADPASAEYYAERAAVLDADLGSLDAWIQEKMAMVAGPRRVITSHDAFSYYGEAYGVEFLYPVGWSTDAEPTAAAVAALIRQLREDEVRVLFVENISDDRLIERIASEGGGVIGGVLYSDALSPADGPAATYQEMMRHNTRTLVEAMRKAGGRYE